MSAPKLAGDNRRPRVLTGRTVAICLVTFFAVVAGVNAIMIRAAVSTFGGVETENAYQAGLAFARELEAVAIQDALHWQVRAKVSPDIEGTRVEVFARDKMDQPLTGLQAVARLVHPTDRRADRAVSLKEQASGEFRGWTAAVNGQWSLVIELLRADERMFRSRNRVFLR